MDLRQYQITAIDNLRRGYQSGFRRQLLVSPTGSGKTVIMGEIIRSAIARGNCVLFVAHRKELIDQASARLDVVGVPHGVIMSGHERNLPWERVQVASVQTLMSRRQRGGALPLSDFIVIDEAHHARAGTYARILDAYPAAPVLGATATPWRTDGRGLGELFEHLVVAARPAELIAQGYLVPYTGFAYDAPDTTKLEHRGSDYEQKGLALVMSERRIVGNVVQQYLEHAGGVRGLVFAVSIAHSKDLVERFKAAGVAAEHLDGEMATGDREAVLARLASGQTRVVSNVGVLTEGYDCPQIGCVMLARPTLSLVLFLQMVGRGLRTAEGKSVCLIHDHAGCFMQHGAPDMEREYALDMDQRSQSKGPLLPPLRTCKKCFAIYPSDAGNICPSCGHVNSSVAQKGPTEIDDSSVRAIPLSELPRFKHADEDTRRRHYEKLYSAAVEKGHRPGAAAMKFKVLYGQWPSASWRKEIEAAAGAQAAR